MSTRGKQSLAFVVNDIDFFFSHRINLAEKLSEKFEIYVFSDTLKISNSKLLKNSSIKYVHIKARRSKNKLINILSTIRYVINLIYLLKLNKIDNVFYITLESSILGAVASKFLNNKNYFVISGTYVLRQSKNLRSIVVRIFSLFQSTKSKFIFQNNEDKDFFEEILGKKHFSFVIKGNGINLNTINFNSIKSFKRIKFIFASDLFYSKGVGEYYDAAVALKNANINADFYMAGKYKKNHAFSIKESLYNKIIKSDAIEYLGAWDQNTFLKNINDYHVFVFPSFGEGMPLAVLEAMASGRALICSKVPGCNECIQEGLNGYFCEALSTKSLIQAINKIMNNQKGISDMGAYSRKIIENEFELNLIYKKYLDVIYL